MYLCACVRVCVRVFERVVVCGEWEGWWCLCVYACMDVRDYDCNSDILGEWSVQNSVECTTNELSIGILLLCFGTFLDFRRRRTDHAQIHRIVFHTLLVNRGKYETIYLSSVKWSYQRWQEKIEVGFFP